MPFAEPRPNRHPFSAQGDPPLIVSPKLDSGNLALTSFTISSQAGEARFVQLLSRKGKNDRVLLMVLVKGGQTLHFPFPHPLMVGANRSLVVKELLHTGALLPATVVGYEWVAGEESSSAMKNTQKKLRKK